MDQLRQVLNTMQAQLTRLTASQKLLMASLAVVMLMTLFIVSQYAGTSTYVPLYGDSTPEDQQAARELLQINDIPFEPRDGQIYVPLDKKYFALAQLSQAGALPADSSLLFSNITDRQSWAMSSEQRRQMERLALQNELALTIAQFDGVRSAKVLIDAPEPQGLGAATRSPTASATVFSSNGQPISQRTVDAVAALVAGAKSGLDPSDIRVIDGAQNTQRRPTSEDDAVASTNFDQTLKVEKSIRDKLLNLLAYIDGVIVAVNAQVDTRRVSTESRRVLPNGAGSQTFALRESSMEETQTASTRSGEPGVRSNTGLDISRGSTGGTQFSKTDTQAELRPEVGYEQQRVIDPRGVVTKLNATINVPRSYFVARYKDFNGADAEPTDADLQPVIDQETARIRADVEPLVDTPDVDDGPGAVVVSMIPDWAPVRDQTQSAGIGGIGLGGGTFAMNNIVKTIALGGLAVLSLGLMARTLKRASKPADLPTAEELVGVPAVPQTQTDMVGEAGEADAALAGVELTEEEIDRRQMLEQVGELIDAKPDVAAALLNKWIATSD